MSIPRRRRYDPATMAATETSLWDVYNNVADVRDDELIKDWNDSLNFLLIFAAIFAAVLTALIVESMRLLQEDTQDLTAAILHQISAQLANNTVPAYQATPFEPSHNAIAVNALLFSSLCSSLIAALAGVIALQWVNEYDARLDTVDSRRLALIRHYRFIGMERWKMAEIIAILPLLLHASVFLFFAGMIVWMRMLNIVVFYICVGGSTLAVVFYMITAAVTATSGNAPFRSPMARGLRFLLFLPALHVTRLASKIANFLWWRQDPRGHLYGPIDRLDTRLRMLARKIPSRLYTVELEYAAAQTSSLESQVIQWTANHVEIAHQSVHRLVHLLDRVYPLLLADKALPGPWNKILDQIAKSHLETFAKRELLDADRQSIRTLLNTSIVLRSGERSVWKQNDGYDWRAWGHVLRLTGPIMMFSGPIHELEFDVVIKLIQLNIYKLGARSSLDLEEISATLFDPYVSPSQHLTSYAISSLSIYLWSHNRDDLYEHIATMITRMISAPPGMPRSTSVLALVSSALHKVAFGASEGRRRFWGSRHPLVDLSQLGCNLQPIQALHSALTSQFASRTSQASTQDEVRIQLGRFCRFLAYTPTTRNTNEADIQRAKQTLVEIPHFMDDRYSTENTDRTNFAGLPSMIWIPKMAEIPDIHKYLELLLSSRRRFPSLKPVWRDWCSRAQMELYLQKSGIDIEWLSTLRYDRKLTELLSSFDQLVENGCSTKEHLVLVRIIVDDLCDDTGSDFDGYYTEKRKRRLMELKDPALRLLGARAANIPYLGILPSNDGRVWEENPWFEAMKFWCERYRDCDPSTDEALLCASLVQRNTDLPNIVVDASSTNNRLQDRLFKLLDSQLRSQRDASVLLIHASLRNVSWFSRYTTENNAMERLLEIADGVDVIDLRLLPLLSSFLPSLHHLHQLYITTTSILRVATRSEGYPCDNDMDYVSTAFERFLRGMPHSLLKLKGYDEDIGRHVLQQMNGIISILRAQENDARAMFRYNGTSPTTLDRQISAETVAEFSWDDLSESCHPKQAAEKPALGRKLESRGLQGFIRGKVRDKEEGTGSDSGKRLACSVEGMKVPVCEAWGYGDLVYSCSAAWCI